MSESANVLEVENLHKVYDNGVHAVNGVDLSVKEGEFLSIIGLSGSGKSSLLRCLNRLVEPTSGKVRFNGTEVTTLKPKPLRQVRKNIGMIFQQFNLVKRKTVISNVLSGKLATTPTWSSIVGSFSEEDHARAMECLRIVELEEKAEVRASELSGGQQQRVAIARTLMQDPELLLADEPVASLDPATSHSVMDHLAYANRELGKTVICNLHFLSLVREYSTRVIALKAGKVIYEGDPKEINDEWFREIYGDEAKEVEIH